MMNLGYYAISVGPNGHFVHCRSLLIKVLSTERKHGPHLGFILNAESQAPHPQIR